MDNKRQETGHGLEKLVWVLRGTLSIVACSQEIVEDDEKCKNGRYKTATFGRDSDANDFMYLQASQTTFMHIGDMGRMGDGYDLPKGVKLGPSVPVSAARWYPVKRGSEWSDDDLEGQSQQ
ncbi:hypothetical protein Tco_0426335 [Tanacetum coccineum]